MFSKAIHETMLTSEVADRLFSNVIAQDTPDKSFLSTLRALLRNRLPRNETAWITCKRLYITEQELRGIPVSQQLSRIIPRHINYSDTTDYGIHIVYTARPDAGEKMLEILKTNATAVKRHMGDYTRRDDLQVFFARKAKAVFYTDAEEKNTVIFTGRLELKHFHVLQMLIPKYLPRLFAGSPLTEREIALLKSTGNKTATEYEALIESFAKDFDIRAEIIRSHLAGFETQFERARADEIRNEISTYQNEYENYLPILRGIADKIQERMYTLAGLECVIRDSSDSELMEYFICNKNLAIIKVIGTTIEFVAHGYADIYDEDAFGLYSANHDGYMYAGINPAISKAKLEKLYRAIFAEGKYKLRICASYHADIRTGLRANRHYTYPPESQTYFPNPHIQAYGCIGTYAARFQEYMRKRDYVGAIEQAIVSARNLNFYDSSAITVFAKDFSRTKIKCIEKPDGTLLSPPEAIKELEGGAECQGL